MLCQFSLIFQFVSGSKLVPEDISNCLLSCLSVIISQNGSAGWSLRCSVCVTVWVCVFVCVRVRREETDVAERKAESVAARMVQFGSGQSEVESERVATEREST